MFGWPTLVHFCDTCGYNTAVQYTGTVWIQEHTCSHCGTKAKGADVDGERKGAMNSHQHDELASLFAQLSTQQQQQQQAPTAPQPPFMGEAQALVHGLALMPEKTDAPITFASTHYTHSWHLSSETQSEPARSPPPPYHETLMPEAMAEMLLQHSIDPLALLPNQAELFANADYEQRLRLLELWRISPPSYPHEQHMQSQFVPTSVAQEEVDAKQRYEQQYSTRTGSQEEHMFDTFIPKTVAPMRGRAASIASGLGTIAKDEAEPYMLHGYQQHSDPVFAGSGLWQAPHFGHDQQQQSTMEDQYGIYQQIRNHADWERMNQQAMGRMRGDDDMVM